jgi:hypothetical protein
MALYRAEECVALAKTISESGRENGKTVVFYETPDAQRRKSRIGPLGGGGTKVRRAT